MTVTLALLLYAASVAVLAPRLVTGDWVYRSPRLGLLAIHAAGLSVLVAVVLAGVACVASPGRLQDCLAALTGWPTGAMPAAVIIGLAVPFVLAARLVHVGVQLTRRRSAGRFRHGQTLSLVGRDDPALGATVVEAEQPAAYCLPGTDRIVVSTGALRLLSPPQLDAVLAHERAHLAGRHHLLVAWAGVLATAFSQPRLFREVQSFTAELVELVADDAAARADHRGGLAEALGAIAATMQPRGGVPGLAVTGGRVLARVERLVEPPPPLSVAGWVGGTGVAASVIALPLLMAAIPAGLAVCPLIFG